MTDSPSPRSGKKSTWRRKLMFGGAGLVLLLVAAYFVLTSSAFFKSVILPRANEAIGGEVTVAEASISPFSEITLRQLKVKTTGSEPLIQAEEVRLRYSLSAILGGTLQFDEITITSPVVEIVENADGTSNLDPLLQQGEPTAPEASPASDAPLQIDLKNFALKNATIRRVKILENGGSEIAELSGLNIALDQFQNGQSGKLISDAVFKYTRPTTDVLEVKSAGQIDFTLGPDLMPTAIRASLEEEVLRAGGSLSQMAGHRSTLDAEITPTEVKNFSQSFFKGERLLGQLKVSGPLDIGRKEGRLKLEIASIDREVLNLIGAPLGIDFGSTTLSSTTEISLTQGGSMVEASSQFNATQFSLTQDGQTTPAVDLQLAYNITVDTTAETAEVQTLTVNGVRNQKPMIQGALTQPMTIAWGETSSTAGDAAFDLAVRNFDFSEWKSVLGDSVSAGTLSLDLKLDSGQGGKQLKLGLTSQITNLAMALGEAPFTQGTLRLKFDGQLEDFTRVTLSDYQFELTQRSLPVLSAAGSAGYDGTDFNLQTQIEAVMSRLAGSGPSTPLSLGMKLNGSFTNQVLDLRQLQVALTPTARAPKNEFSGSGTIDVSSPDITKGSLQIRSDTLDLTQLYDTFAGSTDQSTDPTAQKVAPAPAATGETEPDPVTLPLQITAEANLGVVYLHEMAISDLQTKARVDGSQITLDPCQFNLNGAPVSAGVDLDLGVRGYKYALSMQMDKVPLEPIANTFSPDTRGQYQGLILVDAQITGAGITGAGLQRNLGGQAGFTFTNANLNLIGPKTKQVMVPIATVLGVNEITRTPLNWLDVHVDFGGGNVKVDRFIVQGAAFDARMKGTIPIATVLTNSPLNLPMEFALSRNLAEKSSLMPPNTPPDATYVTLPQFVTVGGTVGAPTSEINKLALSGLLLQSGTGIAEKLGVEIDPAVSEALKGIGGLFGGQKPAATEKEADKKDTEPKPSIFDLFKNR